MAIELATAYVSILPETGKLKQEINKALGEVGKQSEKTGRSMGSKLASGLATTAKVGLGAAGAAAGGAFATSLSKGFGRLTAIQNAESMLGGLGHTASEVADIMNSANEAVTGTAYGLGDAASLAAQMVASGIKPGKELTGVLTTIADTSATAGVDISRFGSIFSKVAASGKMQGEEMNMIMHSGLPILQILGESLGKTSEEVRKMVSEGQISFDIFETALREKLGGASQGANETVQGALSNLGAAMGRFGAEILQGPFNAAPGVIQTMIDKVNILTNATKGLFDYFNSGFADFGEDGALLKAFGTKEQAQPFLDFVDDVRLKWAQFRAGFTDGKGTGLFGALGESVRELVDAFRDALPAIGKVVASLGQAGMGAAIVGIVGAVGTVAPLIADVLVPVLETLGDWMSDNQEVVNAVVMAIAGFTVANSAAGSLNRLIEPAGKIAKVFDKIKGFKFGSLVKNFVNLGKSVGSVAKLLAGGLWKGLMLAVKGIKLLGLAIAANPIGFIITVIAGVIAALVYFFTQTETGKRVWQSFVDKLKEIWAWVKDKFSGLWESVTNAWSSAMDWIQEKAQAIGDWFTSAKDVTVKAFEAISDGFLQVVEWLKWGVAIVATVVITPFVLLWEGLVWTVTGLWDNVLKPVIDAIGDWFSRMWNDYIKPALESVVDGWDRMVQAIKDFWNNQIMPVIQAFGDKMRELWDSYIRPVIDWIVSKWNSLKDSLVSTWNTIKSAVFDAWNTAVDFLRDQWNKVTDFISYWWNWLKDRLSAIWNTIKSAVFDAWERYVDTIRSNWDKATTFMSEQWQKFKDLLSRVWDSIVRNVFNPIGEKLEELQDWFRVGVDAIGKIWDELKRKTAEPLNWVIRTVFNKGIMPVWNTIAGLIGLPEIEEEMKPISGYATGGVLPGYTPGRDPYTFVEPNSGLRIGLSGGEAIMRPEWTRAVGGPRAVEEMNKAAMSGRLNYAHKKYASGGVIDSMMAIVKRKYPDMIMTSGYRPGDGGMHGAGLATDWATPGAFGNSPQQLSLAHDIARTYPGSAELIYDSPGWSGNIKNGANVGPFGAFYTMAQAGAHHNHVHWAMTVPPTIDFGGGVFEGGSDGGGGGFFQSITGYVKGLWDKAISAIPGYDKEATGGQWGKVPANYLKTVATAAWDTIAEKASSVGNWITGGGGGGGGEQYRDQIIDAFRRQGADPKPHLVDALIRQINTESNGDPNIAQQIVDVNGTGPSAGLGLYQFIPSTWAAYRDPSLPDDRTDPIAAHNAAVRYFRDRHGWNTGPTGVGNPGRGWATGGVIPDILTLFDKGGVWPSGTMGVNLSGADEYVFTNAAMRDFRDATRSLEIMAEEIRVAFHGGDDGYGELASVFGPRFGWRIVEEASWIGGAVGELSAAWAGGDDGYASLMRYMGGSEKVAKGILDAVEATGRGVRAVQEWASATTEQDRMGTPAEWGIHFGQMAAYGFADDALSLLGLGGIVGSPIRQSLVDLVNAGADTFNMLNPDLPFRAGHIRSDSLQPVSLLDDMGRRVGTKLQADSTAAGTAETASTTAEPASTEKVITVKMDPNKTSYTADEVRTMLNYLDENLDDLRVEVEDLKADNVASVIDSITTMA